MWKVEREEGRRSLGKSRPNSSHGHLSRRQAGRGDLRSGRREGRPWGAFSRSSALYASAAAICKRLTNQGLRRFLAIVTPRPGGNPSIAVAKNPSNVKFRLLKSFETFNVGKVYTTWTWNRPLEVDRKADQKSRKSRSQNDDYDRMTITNEKKQSLIGDYRRADNDTGSPEIQVAILTTRIGELTRHLKTHKKDFASQRGLLMMVSRRRRQLDYLKRVSPRRYLDIIRRLDIRK